MSMVWDFEFVAVDVKSAKQAILKHMIFFSFSFFPPWSHLHSVLALPSQNEAI